MRPIVVLLATIVAVAHSIFPAELAGQLRNINVCVVESNVLREVEAQYSVTTGDTTVAGVSFRRAYPAVGYAASTPWYINSEPITINGGRYVKYGLPRVLGISEIARFAEYSGVGIYAEAGAVTSSPEVIYVPVRHGCEFQPYQSEMDPVDDPAVFELSDPIALRIPEAVFGELDEFDSVADDGSYYDEYVFTGRAGQTVVVEMRAPEMDAYLLIGQGRSSEFESLESNDDGFEEGTDSRIVYTLPGSGEYVIRANTLFEDEVGDYTLSLREQDAGMPSIRSGQTLRGSLSPGDPMLSDDSYYDEYILDVAAGQRVVITMTSDDFDTYLNIGTGTGDEFESLETNDDGPDMGTDSRVEIRIEKTGTYMVRANSLSGEETGDYTLTVR